MAKSKKKSVKFIILKLTHTVYISSLPLFRADII